MNDGRGVQRFTVDPREVIWLYHRCVRCLCLRVRENDPRRAFTDSSKFFASASQTMQAAQAARPWIDLGGKPFRVVSQGARVVSEPILFEDLNVELTFAAQSDAVLEFKDGSLIVAGYHKAVPVERRQKNRDLELEADAYAIEHAAQKSETHKVDHVGTVEFLVAGPNESSVIAPSRLTLLQRQPKQLADFMHVVARILAARFAPPANRHCELCQQPAAVKS